MPRSSKSRWSSVRRNFWSWLWQWEQVEPLICMGEQLHDGFLHERVLKPNTKHRIFEELESLKAREYSPLLGQLLEESRWLCQHYLFANLRITGNTIRVQKSSSLDRTDWLTFSDEWDKIVSIRSIISISFFLFARSINGETCRFLRNSTVISPTWVLFHFVSLFQAFSELRLSVQNVYSQSE